MHLNICYTFKRAFFEFLEEERIAEISSILDMDCTNKKVEITVCIETINDERYLEFWVGLEKGHTKNCRERKLLSIYDDEETILGYIDNTIDEIIYGDFFML